MKVGHFQCESHPGDVEGNLNKVLEGLERAKANHVEIVSFPECVLTGYQDKEDAVRKSAFALESTFAKEVLRRTKDFPSTAIMGFNEQAGDVLYNTAMV